MGSGEKNFRLSAGKIWLSIKELFKTYTRAWTIGPLAAYYFLYGLGSIIFFSCFPSVTDQAIKALNLLWMHISLIIPIFICGLFGIYAAMARSILACRYFYFLMPLAVACGVPVTITMFNLGCNCIDFLQCSALDSFAKIHHQHLNNPHPAPPGYHKFDAKRRIPFVPFPDDPEYKRAGREPKKGSSFVQSFEINVSHAQEERTATKLTAMYQKYAEKQARSNSLKARYNKIVLDKGAGSLISKTQDSGLLKTIREFPSMRESRKGLQDPSVSDVYMPLPDVEIPWRINPRWRKRKSNQGTNGTPDKKTVHETTFASSFINVHVDATGRHRHNARNPKDPLERNDSSVVPPALMESEQLQALDLYHIKDNPFLIYESGNEKEPLVCTSKNTEGPATLKQHVRQCRRVEDTQCPEIVQEALYECATKSFCGGIKVDLELKVPKTPNEADDEIAKGDVQWNVTVCEMQQPVYVKDYDPEHKKQPNTVYFERDFTKSIDMAKESKEPEHEKLRMDKQEIMPRAEWVEYMGKLQQSTCTCDPRSRSCKASVDRISNDMAFWCAINKDKKDICTRSLRPRIDDLKEMPQAGDHRLWSKKICTGAEMCKCHREMGVRVWGDQLDELNDVLRNQVKESQQSDVMVGWTCGKWFKTDVQPWCVVGFDSPCADRTEIHLNPQENLRVWTSKAPCGEAEFHEVVNSAMEMCSGLRFGFLFADIMKYAMFLPLFYMSYLFLMNRCSDGAPKQIGAFETTGDDEEKLEWLSEETGSGSESYSYSSESEADDPKPKQRAAKSKAKGKAKGKAKAKARKSESEWSDSGAEEASGSKATTSKDE